MESKNFKGSLQFLTKKEGGKKTAIHSECRLKLVFDDTEKYYNVIANFTDVEIVLPGEHVVSEIIFAGNQLLPNDLYAGMSFEVFELSKRIGRGTIIEMNIE